MHLACVEDRGTPPLGVIFGGVLAFAVLGSLIWLELGLPRPVCPLRAWTGIPCLTCGTTRMVEALRRGDPLEAVRWNPLVFGAGAAIAVWACVSATWRVLGLRIRRVILGRRETLALRILALAALVGGWGYQVWRGV